METGIPNDAIIFPNQIRASYMGIKDFRRLRRELIITNKNCLNLNKVTSVLDTMLQRSFYRAAYMYDGCKMYKEGTPADEIQQVQSEDFVIAFNSLLDYSKKKLPEIWKDGKLKSEAENFYKIMNGEGAYKSIVESEGYKKFTNDLMDPKSHSTMYPKTFTILNDD